MTQNNTISFSIDAILKADNRHGSQRLVDERRYLLSDEPKDNIQHLPTATSSHRFQLNAGILIIDND